MFYSQQLKTLPHENSLRFVYTCNRKKPFTNFSPRTIENGLKEKVRELSFVVIYSYPPLEGSGRGVNYYRCKISIHTDFVPIVERRNNFFHYNDIVRVLLFIDTFYKCGTHFYFHYAEFGVNYEKIMLVKFLLKKGATGNQRDRPNKGIQPITAFGGIQILQTNFSTS